MFYLMIPLNFLTNSSVPLDHNDNYGSINNNLTGGAGGVCANGLHTRFLPRNFLDVAEIINSSALLGQC